MSFILKRYGQNRPFSPFSRSFRLGKMHHCIGIKHLLFNVVKMCCLCGSNDKLLISSAGLRKLRCMNFKQMFWSNSQVQCIVGKNEYDSVYWIQFRSSVIVNYPEMPIPKWNVFFSDPVAHWKSLNFLNNLICAS